MLDILRFVNEPRGWGTIAGRRIIAQELMRFRNQQDNKQAQRNRHVASWLTSYVFCLIPFFPACHFVTVYNSINKIRDQHLPARVGRTDGFIQFSPLFQNRNQWPKKVRDRRTVTEVLNTAKNKAHVWDSQSTSSLLNLGYENVSCQRAQKVSWTFFLSPWITRIITHYCGCVLCWG
jgi:hypothetical protein